MRRQRREARRHGGVRLHPARGPRGPLLLQGLRCGLQQGPEALPREARRREEVVVRVGLPAPDFDLPCAIPAHGGSVTFGRSRLRDHCGRWLAVLFYPRDFSLVCPTELTGASARIDEFRANDCDVVGISVDAPDVHAKWLATPQHAGGVEGLAFPLASDVGGGVARAFGVLDEERGVALRGLFLIDPDGRLQCHVVLPLTVGRGTDETLRVLSALRTGGLCPVDWRAGREAIDVEAQMQPGRVVSRYRIEAPLGSGGNAYVFRARDIALDRVVALKVFRPGAKATVGTMIEEARLAAALAHPNICTIYDVDDSEGIPLLAMECLGGVTLARRIAAKDLAPTEAARALIGIASGLAAAHARHIVHGDLKPGNVMVLPGGAAKVLDFGLARRADPRDLDQTRPGPTSGTPRYMSPERFRGHPTTGAADVFAFGVIAWECFTLRPAFAGTAIGQILRAINDVDPAAMAADLPEPWAGIVQRALQPDPAARTVTMAEIEELAGG
ncbi:MAG: redoxin domain-containing protein [Planctomycetes bacterium]|nr:redoxin domain-containing protein [Planctomycetota bacterium]